MSERVKGGITKKVRGESHASRIRAIKAAQGGDVPVAVDPELSRVRRAAGLMGAVAVGNVRPEEAARRIAAERKAAEAANRAIRQELARLEARDILIGGAPRVARQVLKIATGGVPGASAGEMVTAGKVVLTAARVIGESGAATDAPTRVEDMSPDQLRAMLTQLEGELAARAVEVPAEPVETEPRITDPVVSPAESDTCAPASPIQHGPGDLDLS